MNRSTRRVARAAAGVEIAHAGAGVAPGLLYVSDTLPGIRRIRRGGGFVYQSSDGRRLRDADELARIRQLAIPPAYTKVWICPLSEGHLQATGRDARGRKQYRYHPAGESCARSTSSIASRLSDAHCLASARASRAICDPMRSKASRARWCWQHSRACSTRLSCA